ncbi:MULTISPECIES: hypothetical protein [Paenibacillus]|uniref:Uncharacterized protein n=1 Tax=Paenibacillus macquariensis TaxID=948756 RepID=A0ABY1KDP6_9BACL|nr:hypothetical protein [Paenibacillus macquariensis]SIR66483.1 hypothetical protein SAMN05421578_12935 [Paenibacillus macquariensis]
MNDILENKRKQVVESLELLVHAINKNTIRWELILIIGDIHLQSA